MKKKKQVKTVVFSTKNIPITVFLSEILKFIILIVFIPIVLCELLVWLIYHSLISFMYKSAAAVQNLINRLIR